MAPTSVSIPQQLEEAVVLPKNTIKIRTATRTFIVKPGNWLGKSTYFDQLFSGRWADQEADGSYFIDTDDAAFEIILKYLRTAVLPVFYDSVKGHDFMLYHQVLQEAQYFGIDRLCKWITTYKYIDAVSITIEVAAADIDDYAPNTYWPGSKVDFKAIVNGNKYHTTTKEVTLFHKICTDAPSEWE